MTEMVRCEPFCQCEGCGQCDGDPCSNWPEYWDEGREVCAECNRDASEGYDVRTLVPLP